MMNFTQLMKETQKRRKLLKKISLLNNLFLLKICPIWPCFKVKISIKITWTLSPSWLHPPAHFYRQHSLLLCWKTCTPTPCSALNNKSDTLTLCSIIHKLLLISTCPPSFSTTLLWWFLPNESQWIFLTNLLHAHWISKFITRAENLPKLMWFLSRKCLMDLRSWKLKKID